MNAIATDSSKVSKRKADTLKRLRGCVSLPADFDYRKEMEQELSAKYGHRIKVYRRIEE